MRHKTILITGASRGLGLALAEYWSASGNTVVGLARSRPDNSSACASFYQCDLASEAEIVQTVRQIAGDFRKIDILINNAAILVTLPLVIMNSGHISKMIDVNLKAPILLSKSILRKMMVARSGQIVNILSMAPRLSVIGDSVYSATKSGLEAFSKVLNKEGHPFGVHVNNVAISAFPCGMLDNVIGLSSEKILPLIPHKQFAPLLEIIAAIEFFANNSVDVGGQTLYFGGV